MAHTLKSPIQKRFSDLDPFQHVNNATQQQYFDVGKMEYLQRTIGDGTLVGDVRLITASTTTSYAEQIRFEDEIFVTTTCESVGTKSLTLLQRLKSGDTIHTESRSVMVAFDFEAQCSVAVSDAWREALLAEEL